MSQDGFYITGRFNEYQQIMNVINCYIETELEQPNSALKKVEAEKLAEELGTSRGESLSQDQLDNILSVLLYYVPPTVKG